MLKDCPLFESYRDSINKYTRLSNELDYYLKTKEYGNEQTTKY